MPLPTPSILPLILPPSAKTKVSSASPAVSSEKLENATPFTEPLFAPVIFQVLALLVAINLLSAASVPIAPSILLIFPPTPVAVEVSKLTVTGVV